MFLVLQLFGIVVVCTPHVATCLEEEEEEEEEEDICDECRQALYCEYIGLCIGFIRAYSSINVCLEKR